MLKLPERRGKRPRTHIGLPHCQLEQNAPPALFERLAERLLATPDTEFGPSLVSVPGARAMFVPACRRCNTRFGFIRGREYAHLHPPEDGSMHLVLAPDDMAELLLRGWGEPHPLVGSGRILPTVAMVYAPRDEVELETICLIADASSANARWCLDAPD
ncbi:phospholipase [Piscinibacter sakaiensis]|uniref:luciferase domain-containing protein n=1 Tax=Piscinibacter sakaiensis TaxID=1547922 RepID=UPI003AAC6498